MKRLFYIAAAAMAVLSACTKENPIVEVGTEPESVSMPVFTATIEGPATKTTLGEGNKVNWENGDEVYLQYAPAERFVAFNHPTLGPQYAWRQNGETSIGIFDVTPNGSDPSRGTFNLSDQILDGGKSPGEGEKWMLWATYPASLRNRVTGELSFPSTQIFKDNDISFAPMFCGGVLEDEFVMKNTAAILSVTVPSSAFSSVQSIVVSSDQWMNGACELGTDSNWDMVLAKHTNTSTYGNQDDPANKSITLVCNSTGSDTEIPNDGSKTFYISIPVNHYDYLQIDVTDGTTTKSMRTNNPSGIQVERNRIYPITFAENYSPAPAYEYVDLGLSVKWATMNVGATKPEEFGDYFAWGETEPYYEAGYAQEDPQQHWKDGKSDGYFWSSYKYSDAITTSKYCDADSKITLDPEDDAAHVNWGGSWRIPTTEEWDELINNCTRTRTTISGMNGMKFQSNVDGYTDNWIFLPAAGERFSTELYEAGSTGYYWSNSRVGEFSANYFSFESYVTVTNIGRNNGFPIRPVCE